MKKMAESTDEAIEKSKYDDTEIKNKDTEQDSKIEELQTKKTKLEKELKEMQEDYYQTSIRGQASGEYIHVEDSSGARCKIGISGKSEQETRSGKNLFKPLNITSNGITTTYDKDGVGTIKGTSTNTWANISANVIYSYPAGNYVLSIDKPKTFNIHLKGIYTDEEIFEFVIPAGSKTKNVAFKKEVYSMYAFISGFAVGTTLDDTIKIQLEKGSTATDFEQYGLMPSPYYPSEIKAVGDNVNLFDKDNVKIVNGFINYNTGVFSASTSRQVCAYIKVKPNTTYSISGWTVNNDKTLGTFTDIPSVGNKATNYVRLTSETSTKITTGENDNYIVIFIYNNVYPQQNDKIKIEKGSISTQYSPYGQGSVKVTKCNKNLSKYKTFTSTSSARVVGDTTTSGQQIEGIKVRKGKKYTISFDVVSLPSSDYRIQIRESTDESVAQTNGEIPNSIQNEPLICNTLTRHSKTITAQGDNYLYIRCIPNGFVLDNIQVEEKETSTHYEQHEEQSYIMPVQKEMLQEDYFDFDNEEEVHTCDKLVLNGTEDIKIWIVMDDYYGVYISATEAQDISAWSKTTLLSNTFKTVQGSVMNNKTYQDNCVATWGKNIFIRIEKSIIGGNDDNTNDELLIKFKSYLKSLYDAGTPVMIYYKLQTPTRIAFTAEQKAVAKELNNARTYKNVTNITTDSKAILSLDYVKDQETQNQKMQNEIDEIKQLLSTTQTSAMLLDNLQKEVESEVE